jgi:hypothetical protein
MESGDIVSTDMACVSCTDSTGTYPVGATWSCPDGCNTCSCMESGEIASTRMACE